MLIRTTSPAAWLALALVTGCAEWPRFGNLPDDGALVPASTDPGSLVTIAWAPGLEGAGDDNDLPTGADVPLLDLAHGEGFLVRGTLDGLGWSDTTEPEQITSASCAGATGTRSPLQDGDYLGDVDFFLVDVPVGSTLCARVMLDIDTTVGWDLVPFEADACGIPAEIPSDDLGEPVGVDGGGVLGGWGIAATHDRYAILFAGYHPNDGTAQVDYVVGVSVVAGGAGGRPGICPLLPDENAGAAQ